MYFQWRKEWTTPAVGAVSFAAGAAAGYFYMRRQADLLVDTAIEITHEMDDLTAGLNMEADLLGEVNPFIEPLRQYQQVLDGFVRAVNQLGQAKEIVFEGVTTTKDLPTGDFRENVAEPRPMSEDIEVEDGWDYEEELAKRTPDAPYVIHRDEFFNQESGFRGTTIQWYEGDKILADENDVPIYGPEKVTGNLVFGFGSGDPNVVYIRNEKLRAEYEVVRNPGFFQIEVLGLQLEEQAEADDLKHSQAIRRFRMD
jgi:hypothetical protein